MNLDPTLAQTVAAVLEEGTMDAAARRLRITPSAVSQRLKLLENQLGQRLVVRSKPARATLAGRVVARFARHYTLLEHDARVGLGQDAAGARVRLPLAINSDSLAAWILPALARVADRHAVELDLYREDQDRTASLLEEGTVLAAVTSRADPVAGCRASPLGSMTFEAVAAPGWFDRWAPDGPTPQALERAPRIDYDRGDGLQLEWLRRQGVQPQGGSRHLVPSTHDIARAVELGLGWAMIPAPQAGPLVEEGRLRRLGGPAVTTPLFWQRWKEASSLLDALTDEVLDEAQRFLERP